jgi:hypothetical protein
MTSEEAKYKVIGMSEKDALDLLRSNSIRYRLTSRDGQSAIITRDLNPARVNLSIREGKVTGASLG